MPLGTHEALGIGIQADTTGQALDIESDYISWNVRNLGCRFSDCIERQALRCRFKLRRLEHMKPWTQVVRFMASTVNPKGSVLQNELRTEHAPRK